MCGIVGNVFARADRTPDPAVLKRMNDRLAHRGPDDEGFFLEGPAALAMRRLKIIDLATGQQPMHGEHSSVWSGPAMARAEWRSAPSVTQGTAEP